MSDTSNSNSINDNNNANNNDNDNNDEIIVVRLLPPITPVTGGRGVYPFANKVTRDRESGS